MTTLEPQRISQPSPSPTVKVAAGSTAGAVSVVLVYAIGLVHQVPAEVGSARHRDSSRSWSAIW